MKTKEKIKKSEKCKSKGPLAIHFAYGCRGYRDDSNAYPEKIEQEHQYVHYIYESLCFIIY
jgi:tRNA(Ile)-lysidine synthase TilS/MesJ